MLRIFVFALCLCSTGQLSAAVILTFDEFAITGSGSETQLSYTTGEMTASIIDDFIFTNVATTPPTPGLQTYGTLNPRYAGSAALAALNPNSITTLARVDGAAFDLFSIDIARLNKSSDGSTTSIPLTFTAVKEDGSSFTPVAATVVVGNDQFQTVNFTTTTEVTSVSWGQESPFHQFDNVTVSAVPEPTSLAFLGVGLGVAGVRRARRKHLQDAVV